MTNGQLCAIQNHFAIHVGYGHFRCGDEEGISVHFVGILFKLGQLTCARHGGTGHHVGGIHFIVAIFDMRI